MQFRKQPRRGNVSWISGKHAGHVRPYFEASRLQLRGNIGGGGIRTASTQQYGFTTWTARNETLGQDYFAA